jgi:hypothetical protein
MECHSWLAERSFETSQPVGQLLRTAPAVHGGSQDGFSLNKPSRPGAVRRLARKGLGFYLEGVPVVLIACCMLVPPAFCQQDNPPESQNKRIFGIIPNFRTSPELKDYEPLTAAGKFKIAKQDSFDRGTVALAALFAGHAQLTDANPSFGQGVEGYAHYFGTAYADFVIGNYMTEGIFPTILHQDPRYFRRGRGSGLSRLGYSAGQIFFTHGDSGHTQFNFSEIGGNATAVAISMAYYPDHRDVSEGVTDLGVQLGVDMATNILKEFAPDISRKFSRKHHHAEAALQ